MHQHGTFIRSIRTNEGWARSATHATHVAVRQGCDVGVGQGKSMVVALPGNALALPLLQQPNTIRPPRTTAGMRPDKRANRQSDVLGTVERRQEFGRTRDDDEEEAASNMPTHTHGRTHRAIKRPFWSDCMSG